MAFLFVGGEDVDFPNGSALSLLGSPAFRSGYARAAFWSAFSGNIMKSTTFQGGAVTSAWLTFRLYTVSNVTSQGFFGFGLSGTNKGLFVGGGAAGNNLAILKYDGTTWTVLAASSGTELNNVGVNKIDLHVSSYGATATVTLYYNGTQIATYTGDVTVSGVTNLDSVYYYATGGEFGVSEIVVSDVDTRSLVGLVTLALTGQGTTDSWTAGTYSDINAIGYSDANPAYTNTTGQDEQFAVNGLPAGTWTIAAVKTTVRAAQGTGSAATKVNLGYSDGTTPAFGGTAQSAGAAYGTLERYDTTNPVTATAWAQADFTGLEMDLRSA